MDPLNTQPTVSPQAPAPVTNPDPINPASPTTPPFTNPVSPPDNKAKKTKLIALTVLVLAVVAGAAYFFLANKPTSSDAVTKNGSLGAIDESTGIHYKKIKSTDLVRVLGEKSYGGAVNGVLVYEGAQGTVPSGTTVPAGCSFNQSDFGSFEGGMVILKDSLKDNGVSYSSIQDIVELYEAETSTSLIDMAGTKVARIDDGGDGLFESCAATGKKFRRALDFTTTYVVLTKSGKEITVALVQSDNTVNSVSIDAVTHDKASKFFDENDLKAQVEYIVANN